MDRQENNGFGPIFKPRGKAVTFASVVIATISGALLVFALWENEDKEGISFVFFATALLMISVIAGELIRRVSMLAEEIRHKQTRYRGEWRRVLKSTFAFEYSSCILVVGTTSTLFVCYAMLQNYESFLRLDYAIFFILNCFVVPQLVFLVGLREPNTVEATMLNERDNKNVADGFAWNYYFGYLKLVLPRLEAQIAKSSEFRYKITKKKLYILVPKTCYVYDNIADADPRVTWAGDLTPCKINRGGIRERIYKQAVYRVDMSDKPGMTREYFFILEYASNLMSLYDMSLHEDAPFSRQERDDQVIIVLPQLKSFAKSANFF